MAGDASICRISLTQDWERDSQAVVALDAKIAECERFNGVPANRLLLSGSRNVGRGYSIDRHVMPNSRLARHALSDNMAGTNVIRRMFRFAFDMLDTTKPDLIIAGEWTTPLYCNDHGGADTWHKVSRQPEFQNRFRKLLLDVGSDDVQRPQSQRG